MLIAHTVALQELPDLPPRPKFAVYSAALVVSVLGLGYCLPINSYRSMTPEDAAACELTGPGPFLTTGDIMLAGSVALEQERRMWTVHETRTAYPGAKIAWASDPSVRDVDYRVELDARSSSAADGEPVVSRSWDIGTGGVGDPSEDMSYTHTRHASPDGDTHVADVEVPESDGDQGDGMADDLRDLGTHLWMDVRLIAGDEVVAECGGAVDYAAVDDVS